MKESKAGVEVKDETLQEVSCALREKFIKDVRLFALNFGRCQSLSCGCSSRKKRTTTRRTKRKKRKRMRTKTMMKIKIELLLINSPTFSEASCCTWVLCLLYGLTECSQALSGLLILL